MCELLSHHQKVFARFFLTLLGIWLNRPPKTRAGGEGIVTFEVSGIRLFMGLVKRLVLCYAQNQGLFKEDRGRIAWLGSRSNHERSQEARQAAMEGAEDRVGRIDRFETLADVIEHFQKNATQAD